MVNLRGSAALVGYSQVGLKDVEVIQVVRTNLARRGKGIEADPHRRVTQYWTLDGDLLAEVDPWPLEGPSDLEDRLREDVRRYEGDLRELAEEGPADA